MKKMILSLLLLAGFTGARAQQPFEGTIVYSQTSKATNKDKAPDLTVRFGKRSIRVSPKASDGTAMDDLLIKLDSGVMYTLKEEEKTFRSKPLISTESNALFVGPTEIAGHKVTSFNLADRGYSALNAVMARIGKIWLYPANDLYYPVPVKYLQNMELCMIHEGKIVLGITIIDQMKSFRDSSTSDTVTLQALSVTKQPLQDSLFEVPKDYTAYVEPVYDLSADTLATAVDSVASVEVVDYPAPAGPPAAPKKKISKKKTTSNRQPARKPPVKK